jgi:hypothetical protein
MHVEGLLAVEAEREVEEGDAVRGELHRGREPALHHRQVARGELSVEPVYVGVDLHAGYAGETVAVDARGESVHETGPREWQQKIRVQKIPVRIA